MKSGLAPALLAVLFVVGFSHRDLAAQAEPGGKGDSAAPGDAQPAPLAEDSAAATPSPADKPEGSWRHLAPWRTGRNNLLHALVLIPEMEGAETLPAGRAEVGVGFLYAKGDLSRTSGSWRMNYETTRLEGYAELTYGIAEALQVSVRQNYAGLRQDGGSPAHNLALVGDGKVYADPGSRGGAPAAAEIGLKYRFLTGEDQVSGVAAFAQVKVSEADKKDFIDSRGADAALGLGFTKRLSNTFTLTGSLAGAFPGEEHQFGHDLNPRPMLVYGAGILCTPHDRWAVGLQLEGNTNAFPRVQSARGAPLTIGLGVRYAVPRVALEVFLGAGLNQESSEQVGSAAVRISF